jgi:exonuclease SbcC
MILRNLKMINFRKFKDTTVEFPDGVTGIIGLNGAGKSTIFEAIAWVLYGSVATRTSANEIKRIGSIISEPCRVELEFDFEEDSYRIVREMSGKNFTVSATATVNGKVAATSTESVNKYIQKKLGMDFKSFFTSIFAKQKELNALSSMNASERRPLILRMLGIDSLDDVIKEIKSDKKEKDALLDRLNEELVDDVGKDKIRFHMDQIEVLDRQRQDIDKSIKKLKRTILTCDKELKILEKKLLESKKEYEKINEQKEKLTEQKTLFENKEKVLAEIKLLKEKINQRQRVVDGEKKKLDGFKNTDQDIKSTERRQREINEGIEKIVRLIEHKKTLSERIKKDIFNLEKKQENIEKLGPDAECPTCERVLSDQHDVLLKKFVEEKKKASIEIETFSNDIKKNQKEKDKFFREQQALLKKMNYLQIQLREKERINTTIINISTEINHEVAEKDNKDKMLEKIGTVVFDIKDFERVKKQVEVLYKKYQNSVNRFSEKKDDSASLHLDLEKKEGEKKLFSQEIKGLKEKIIHLEEFKKQIKEEKKTVYYFGMLGEVMASFRTYLISKIRPTLSDYSSDFFERLTDGKYREINLDENYNLLVFDDGSSYGIERFSGGEEDLANLCLRLAISEVITERAGGVFNFIILDEIFGSQDVYRRQNIMNALNGLSSKFRQIFLITHVDDVKDNMENILFVTENEEGISTVKIE